MALAQFNAAAGAQLKSALKKLMQPGNESADGYTYGAVSGEHNFDFSFRLEATGHLNTGILVA